MTSENQSLSRATRQAGPATALAVSVLAAGLAVAGCGPKPDPAAAAAIQSTGPKIDAPAAQPGAVIGAGNPPAGQPNHMSPAMQAQLQHYQAMGQKK